MQPPNQVHDASLKMGSESSSAFPETLWTVVSRLNQSDPALAKEAMEKLCRIYWYPIYATIRRKFGRSHEDASDLTQGFLASLSHSEMLKKADRDKGKFRTFLSQALVHFSANEWHRQNAIKRGGNVEIVSIDGFSAEERFRHEPVDPSLTPEQSFDRQWAQALLDRARARLRQEYAQAGSGDAFTVLQEALGGEASPYAEYAAKLGKSEATVKVTIHRMRKKFGDYIREEVAQTVRERREIDGEIRDLFSAVSL